MKKILLCAVAGIFLASCSEKSDPVDGGGNGGNERVPIVLSSSLTAESQRASRQDNQIAAGQQVSFFVTRTGNSSDIAYSNARLTADGLGNFSYDSNGETTLYYPVYTDNVDFYAIHPYGNITLGNDYTFAVQQDQSPIRNFLNSDLLFAKVENQARTSRPVQLLFDHELSKVSFVVLAGAGTDVSGLDSIEILNVQPQVILDTELGGVTEGSAEMVDVVAYGLADDFATVSPTEVSGVSAIIPPQTFAANTPLFRLRIDNVAFVYTPSAPVTFNPGTSYRYRLTLTATGIIVTSEINPWTPTEDQEGSGTIE